MPQVQQTRGNEIKQVFDSPRTAGSRGDPAFPLPHNLDRIPLVCPSCQGALTPGLNRWSCSRERITFGMEDGIPSFVLLHSRASTEIFLRNYRTVRDSEGWGSSENTYYRCLPFKDTTGLHSGIWRIRSRTYECFVNHLLTHRPPRNTRVLDLGAGNCWLSLRLADLGFTVVAVDIDLDPSDGLGVLRRFHNHVCAPPIPVRADFTMLPFPPDAFDIVIFAASLHYSHDIAATLENALRLLSKAGILYILDSPLYRNPSSGERMVRERNRRFQRDLGLHIPEHSEGSFLSSRLIESLKTRYRVEVISPHRNLGTTLRPWLTRLLFRREAASFNVIAIHRD